MYNLQINELTPGRKYYVKVRAKAPDLEVSDWSPIFEFTTSQDTVPPHRVGNLTFVSQGDSFIGQWNAPTINADGTPCTDLSHYVLRLTNIDTEVTVTIRSSINSFTLDFNNNRQLFGTPAGRIKIEVAAVDIVGNTGAYEEAIAQNPAPAKVQNVSATAGVESINLSWDAGSDTDISHYEIHVSTTGSGFTPGTTTYRGQVSAGTTTYTYGTSSISTVFLKVIAVDKFNQKSVPSDAASAQPKLSTDYDKTPPGVVGGFTVTQILSPDNNSAIARISYTPRTEDDLDKYEVQYRKTGETALPWSFANVPSDQSTAEIKPLPLSTNYDFRIRAVDFNANKGAWSPVVVAAGIKKTTLPAAPTGIVVTGGLTNLMITWSASNDPSMANWAGTYEVQIDQSNSFSNPTVVTTSSTLASFINLEADTVYYVRVRAIDPYSNVGVWSEVVDADTGTVESEIPDNSITSEKLAADSVLARHILAGEITGEKLAANTAIVNNLKIESSVDINPDGHIKSSNYELDGETGFYMDQQQLIINQGKISAAALEIQDSYNRMPAAYATFDFNPVFYETSKLWHSGISATSKVASGGVHNGGYLSVTSTMNGNIVLASPSQYNIPIDDTGQYIISFYVNNRSNKTIRLQPYLYNAGGGSSNIPTATNIQSAQGWVRYSVVVNAPTATRTSLRINTLDMPGTFWLDAIQVEKKIGSLNTPSPWTPPGSTSIDGESITTGQISSNNNVTVGNDQRPAWSINLGGNAEFMDAVVRGKLVVGGYGTDQTSNDKVSVQSDQYITGISGWAIKGSGDVEFNNGTFRGILTLGTAANESIKPTMNASVSNVKLFINDSDHQDINVASIRGVTYAYDRAQTGGEGPYYPKNPVPSKIGRYYFGPTTDRSVNIQVHEGEEDAVYLETPPNDVALTSMYVGELTSPAEEPVERERQGFGFSATRIETDPSTPSRESSTGVSQSSSVQLRSPFYPESLDGEYPESTHLFESKVDFRSPLSKNLFFRSYALPDLTIGDGTTSRTNRPDYVSRAYDLTNEINKSTYVKVPVSGAGNPTGTKRHIFSAYIDTLDAFTDTAVYAFANNVPMNPIGDNKLSVGATQYQHADTLSTLAPDYRYQFNTAADSYSNSGSGSQVLTRTQGSVVTGPESSIFAFSNTSYTAPSTYNMNLGMTFSVWFQPSYVSGEQVFFHRGAASMREIWIRYNATNRTFTGGMVSASTTTWSAPNNLIDPAKWNQVTFTFDSIGAGTKNMRIYVNGVLQFTQVMSGWTTAFSTEPLYLFSNVQATSFYLGGLSEPMVFHKVLTAAQVTSLYNRGTPIYRAGGLSTLSQNGILVESGNAAQRVAFEYTPSSTVATTITLQVVGASSNTVLAYKIQLERASYQENVNLPDRIRAKIAPTPWMTNGSNSLSTASLKLKAEPSPDIESWSTSSLGDYQRMGPRGIEANKKKSPAELELSLSSSYSHPGGGSATSASATYKWGTTGMSYPGSKFPFMPAAASIIWDYNSLASASRPPIGGSGNLITTINLADSSFGAINTGAGKSLEDTFTASNGTQLGYPWIRVGTPDLPIYANAVRIQKHASGTSGLPADFVYNAEPLIQTNQEVHIRVDSAVVTFGSAYRYNGALVINYDPNTDSGIFARVRDGGTRLWEVYVMNNGLITYSTSGTFSTAVNNWTDFKLRRENSNVRLTLGNVILFNGTIGTLPTGKYVGFSMDAGRMDDFNAYDIAPGSTAMGMLLPESVNVNEGRGIFVNPNGVIAVDVPGYYMVTGCVRGAIGGDIARTYWLEIFETRPGEITKTHPISGWQNRSSSNMDYVFGSGICYLEGTVEFRIATHTTNVSRISGADLHIVRMA